MKFGIDVRWMNNNRGMAQFAKFFIEPIKKDIIGLACKNNDVTTYPTVNKGNSFFPWWEQCILPRLSNKQALDFLILPYNTGPILGTTQAKQIAVIHDLIFMRSIKELPLSVSSYQILGRYYRRFVVPRVAKKADIIVTVSEYTKSELVEKLDISKDRIRVIPNSIHNEWFSAPIPLSERQPYLFTVTGSAPSKNVPDLIKAFAIARNKFDIDLELRIAGINIAHQAPFIARAKELGVEEQVKFLGFLSDKELMLQYRQARAFVFASLYEGFGIPLLEAMASGTPVCCSNSTSLPEVVGDTALLFDPTDVDDIANNLVLVLTDSEVQSRALAAYSRASEFSEDAVNEKIKAFWGEFCQFDS